MTVSSETRHIGLLRDISAAECAPKLAIVVAAVLGVAVLIGFYVGFLTGGPTPYTPPAANAATGEASI